MLPLRRILSLVTLTLLSLAASPAEVVSPGDLLVASQTRPPFDGVPVAARFTVHGPDGERKLTLDDRWGLCRGLLGGSRAGGRILCGEGSQLTILSFAGAVVAETGEGNEHLGEVLLTPRGEMVVAQETSPSGPRLFVFDSAGTVKAVHDLPRLHELYSGQLAGMDLMPDGCTIVYTIANHYAFDFRRIARFDICKGEPRADLFRLPSTATGPGAVRVLPDGDLLVAAGYDIRRFNETGEEEAIFYFPGQRLALTPDASGFWSGSGSSLRFFSFSSRYPLRGFEIEYAVGEIAVVDEWRAAVPKSGVRQRAVRH